MPYSGPVVVVVVVVLCVLRYPIRETVPESVATSDFVSMLLLQSNYKTLPAVCVAGNVNSRLAIRLFPARKMSPGGTAGSHGRQGENEPFTHSNS